MLFFVFVAAFTLPWHALSSEAAASGKAIVSVSGRQTGLCVHLGVTDGELTAALGTSAKLLVHGLAFDATSLAKARAHVQSKNLYGQVSIELFRGRLARPYGANGDPV